MRYKDIQEEAWPIYARDRLHFICKPIESFGAGIAVAVIFGCIALAVL